MPNVVDVLQAIEEAAGRLEDEADLLHHVALTEGVTGTDTADYAAGKMTAYMDAADRLRKLLKTL